MADLERLMAQLIDSVNNGNVLDVSDESRYFIEHITFAGAEEILSSLRNALAEDWMGLPVWARNLAYRLACLQRPDDSVLLREAAADLLSFGPDWDRFAENLKERAGQLESQSESGLGSDLG